MLVVMPCGYVHLILKAIVESQCETFSQGVNASCDIYQIYLWSLQVVFKHLWVTSTSQGPARIWVPAFADLRQMSAMLTVEWVVQIQKICAASDVCRWCSVHTKGEPLWSWLEKWAKSDKKTQLNVRPLRVSQMGSIEHSRLNVVETERWKYMIIPYKTLKSKFKN